MHVEMGLDSMFSYRPLPELAGYRTPVRGLYPHRCLHPPGRRRVRRVRPDRGAGRAARAAAAVSAVAYGVRSRQPSGVAARCRGCCWAPRWGSRSPTRWSTERGCDRVTVATVVLFAATSRRARRRAPRARLGAAAAGASRRASGWRSRRSGCAPGCRSATTPTPTRSARRVLDVPVVVPLAWTMMAYPVLLAARRLTRRWVVLVGAIRPGGLGRLPRPADGRRRPLDLGRPDTCAAGRARRPADQLRRLAAGRWAA